MEGLVLFRDDWVWTCGRLDVFKMVLNEEVSDFAMRKIITTGKFFVGFAGWVSAECVDLNVAGKAFQILQRFDVAFVALNGLDGGC